MHSNLQKNNNMAQPLPKHGFITEIAKAMNCHRTTVSNALYKKQKGVKAAKIREYFKKRYQNG